MHFRRRASQFVANSEASYQASLHHRLPPPRGARPPSCPLLARTHAPGTSRAVSALLAVLTPRPAQDSGDDPFAELEEALTRYSQEMHAYTLRQWTDSRRAAEEKWAPKKAAGKTKSGSGQHAAPKGRPHDDSPLASSSSGAPSTTGATKPSRGKTSYSGAVRT